MTTCPPEDHWLELAVGGVLPPRAAELHAHRVTCAICDGTWASITELTSDLSAPPRDIELDVDESVAALMDRITREDRALSRARFLRWSSAAAGGLAAAAASILLVSRGGRGEQRAELQARGGADASGHTLGRQVGFRLLRIDDGGFVRLRQGDSVDRATTFTGTYRNIGDGAAHLLVFAVDARDAVHWLYPAFTDPSTDPRAVVIEASRTDVVLPTSVRLEAPAVGTMRVIALIAPQDHGVSEVEALAPTELSRDALARRFPEASVEELSLEVLAEQRFP